jgi:hypothetical protein
MATSKIASSKDATGRGRTGQEQPKLWCAPTGSDFPSVFTRFRPAYFDFPNRKSAANGLPSANVPWYIGTTMKTTRYKRQFVVERVQTGVRIEKRLLKVLKALAEFHDLTLGDLLEGIVLHSFDGKEAFQKPSRRRIKELKKFYGLDLDFRTSHRLIEARPTGPKAKTKPAHGARRVRRALQPKKTRGAK